MRLKELEKRLKTEPDNLGLRVTLAGMWRQHGRTSDAVEMYRSVALAYRDRGRVQQAIAVCRSILEIAPDDQACQQLLVALRQPQEEPKRRSSGKTPLPAPVPHHVADPTSSQQRISTNEVTDVDRLPMSEGATTRPGGSSAGEERPSVEGLAQAARRISGLFATESARVTPFEDLSAELETRQRPRLESEQVRRVSLAPPTVPVDKVDDETVPRRQEPRDSDDELTRPRARVDIADPTEPVDALDHDDDG